MTKAAYDAGDVARPTISRVPVLPPHDWTKAVTTPSGVRGFACRCCGMTAAYLPVPAIVSTCHSRRVAHQREPIA